MNEEFFETPSSSPNFQTELAAQLAELVPEAVADGKIDVLKLQELLANDSADSSERFGLFWPGKQRSLRVAQMPTTSTLRPEPEKSREWDTTKNVFIEGDNLEVLKILQKHYHGKIKLVYIDPPYNTGKDFVYPDNYKEGLANYLEWTRQVNEEGKKLSTNSETEGRYHSNWLNMMYPRLKLARNLLTEDGAIVIHIDEHEAANLERLMCEIFGESNNLGTIIWDKRNPKGDSIGVAQQHEVIVLFSKNKDKFTEADFFKRPKPNAQSMLAMAEKLFVKNSRNSSEAQREFREWLKKQDLSGGEAAYNNIDENGEVFQPVSMAWPNKKQAPDDYKVPLIHPITGKACPVPPRGWRNPSATMKQLLSEGKILFGKDETTQPRRKYLLKENLNENFASMLYFAGSDDALLNNLSIPFDNPKPISVAKQLIASIARDSDTVLDFFAGSGTTAHAIFDLNFEDKGQRKFILVQLPEPTEENSEERKLGFDKISEITRARINRAADLIENKSADSITNELESRDFGFRSFKLADSGFVKWQADNDVDRSKLEQHLFTLRDSAADEAGVDALLTEILLKQGYSLSESVTTVSIGGLDLFSVGEGLVFAYLDEKIKPTLDSLREAIERGPAKFIVLEDAFQGDDELKTNLSQLCKSKNVELWTS